VIRLYSYCQSAGPWTRCESGPDWLLWLTYGGLLLFIFAIYFWPRRK